MRRPTRCSTRCAALRRAGGLAGTTINWGPWADVGMSAAVSEQDRRRWHYQGVSLIGRRQGTALLGRFLDDTPAQVAALPVQWGVLLQQFPAGKVPALLRRPGARHRVVGRSGHRPRGSAARASEGRASGAPSRHGGTAAQ